VKAADDMQWAFRPAEPRLGFTASPIMYLNRAAALDDLHPRALLENSGRPSIDAPLAIAINSAVDLFAAAYGEADLTVIPIKWANSLAALGDPWQRALLANTAPPSTTAQVGLPINEAVARVEHG